MVVLTVSLALVVLALAVVGLRVAAGETKRTQVVDLPARLNPLPTTSLPPPSTPGSSTPPTTTPSAIPALDTATPKITVSDTDGQFRISVPRSWVNLPGAPPDTVQFRLFEQAPDGTVSQSQYLFVVRWFDARGCTLERCAAEHVLRLQAGRPSVVVTPTPQVVAGRPGIRLDSSVPEQRLAGFLVVEADRYWAMELVGPPEGFDDILRVVEPVLATMSFG